MGRQTNYSLLCIHWLWGLQSNDSMWYHSYVGCTHGATHTHAHLHKYTCIEHTHTQAHAHRKRICVRVTPCFFSRFEFTRLFSSNSVTLPISIEIFFLVNLILANAEFRINELDWSTPFIQQNTWIKRRRQLDFRFDFVLGCLMAFRVHKQQKVTT